MSNMLKKYGEIFDPDIHERIKKIDSLASPTNRQIDRLKRLEKKYYIAIKWSEVTSMIKASEKISNILKALADNKIKLR